MEQITPGSKPNIYPRRYYVTSIYQTDDTTGFQSHLRWKDKIAALLPMQSANLWQHVNFIPALSHRNGLPGNSWWGKKTP